MRLLATGKGKSLNMKGAYLEVWSDMLGSLGVIVGALLIYFTGWTQIDPLIAIAIALWVLPRTYVLLKESMNVLLEGVPRGIDLDRIEAMMRADASVRDVHELHVWSLSSRSEEHTSELQSLMRISYAVFCLKKKQNSLTTKRPKQ